MDAPELEALHPASRDNWRQWLMANHDRQKGIWVVFWRKASGQPDMSYDEAVEEALCFGWVDSKPRALDARRTMLWFAPRKPRSGWSGPNKQRVERAIASGRMTSAGLARITAAREDGSWDKLNAVESLDVPPDLAEALQALPGAAAAFDGFPRSVRRGILEWIVQAKRPDTRHKRITETATMAAQGKRANQWRA